MGVVVSFAASRSAAVQGGGWMDKGQVAREFKVSVRTVERWLAAGCPCLRMGGEGKYGRRTRQTVRFNLEEVTAWHRLREREQEC